MEKIEITSDEYPPKYVGTKGNCKKKMVYRVNGEMGLVFHMKNKGISQETEYRWEHFVLIQKYK